MSERNGKGSMVVEGANGQSVIMGAARLQSESKAMKSFSTENDIVSERISQSIENGKMAEELSGKMVLRPENDFIIIKRLNKNPFKPTMVTKSGLVLESCSGEAVNPNTGEIDKMEPVTEIGEVIDPGNMVGISKGDYVYFRRASSVEIPYMGLGYEALMKMSVICTLTKKQ